MPQIRLKKRLLLKLKQVLQIYLRNVMKNRLKNAMKQLLDQKPGTIATKKSRQLYQKTMRSFEKFITNILQKNTLIALRKRMKTPKQ